MKCDAASMSVTLNWTTYTLRYNTAPIPAYHLSVLVFFNYYYKHHKVKMSRRKLHHRAKRQTFNILGSSIEKEILT